MRSLFKYLLLLLSCLAGQQVFAQVINPYNPNNQTNPYSPNQTNQFLRPDTARRQQRELTGDELMDSLRRKEEKTKDSVVFTSKFIRVTNEHLMADSTQVFPVDTSLNNFENYNPLYQPRSPRIGLGSTGLAQRPLLFEPEKRIGFDVGLHAMDAYLFTPQDVQYYKARVPYTSLYFVGGGRTEQVFRAMHTQNINPQLNFGANFNIIGSNGYYPRQNVSDLNAAVFVWYESKSKRYNLLVNSVYNNFKTPESGAVLSDTVITGGSFSKLNEPVRLINARSQVQNNTFYFKQFYYIGRIDTNARGAESNKILPTQRVTHTFSYNRQNYLFNMTGPDTYKVFPDYYYNSTYSNDSLAVTNLHNDFSYSFYLRGKSVSFVKNELKLNVGIAHDLYTYNQFVSDSVVNENFVRIRQMESKQKRTFQNITLKARFGYRFSDRVVLEGNFQQVAQGYNFGDYLYDAKLILAGGGKTGRIVLGAYAQNNRAPLVYTDWVSNHWRFDTNIGKQQTNSASFNYINEPLGIDLKAEYFLITGYLYFQAQPGGVDATPTQLGSAINLLKISLSKTLSWRRWHFDNHIVYQKTDFQNTLRTPEFYTYSNLYYRKLMFGVLNTAIGAMVRYNTTYLAPSYAIGISQFYNGPDVRFTSQPFISAYLKATLKSTNIFVMYDYANQGLFSKGFYTVNRYPMQDRLLKIGVSWNFYN